LNSEVVPPEIEPPAIPPLAALTASRRLLKSTW
jgi:hypothetical protein